jgi:hypothetical protein
MSLMMGHRETTKGGCERDAFSKRCRRLLGVKPGKFSRVKSTFNRRVRREVRNEIRNEVDA